MDIIGDTRNFQNVANSIHGMREEMMRNRKVSRHKREDFPEAMLIQTLRKDAQERRQILKGK